MLTTTMICKTALLFLAVSCTSTNAARLGTAAPRGLSSEPLAVFVPRDPSARTVNKVGGWALSQTSAETCPATAPQCGASWCCPGSLQCIHTGGEDSAEVCCPTDTDCSATFLAAPICADASWSLWNATSDVSDNGGFFCCLQHQVGLQSGACADYAEAVTAGATALQLATGIGSVEGEAPATSVSGASTTAAPTTTGSVTSATGKGASSSSGTTTGAAKTSSSITSSSISASSSTAATTGKSGATGSYNIGMTSLGGALAAAFAFALL